MCLDSTFVFLSSFEKKTYFPIVKKSFKKFTMIWKQFQLIMIVGTRAGSMLGFQNKNSF